MLKQQSLFQSLAASCAVLIAFIGVCHEIVGARLFPWAPSTVGSVIGWHGIGIGSITIGLFLLGGTLRLIRFPVFPWALAVAAASMVVALFTAVVHGEFHLFAFTAFLAAIGAAFFHREALRLSAIRRSG